MNQSATIWSDFNKWTLENLICWMLILQLSKRWRHATKIFARGGTSPEWLLVVEGGIWYSRISRTVGQEWLASILFEGREVEMGYCLWNVASVVPVFHTGAKAHLIMCLCGIVDPTLCLYSSEVYCNKYECLPVKLIQPFVLWFRSMFFILCWE